MTDPVAGNIASRPTLAAWLREYRAIEDEFVAQLAEGGIGFAPRDAARTAERAARERLRRRGARFMNGEASISCGFVSSACEACVGGQGSKTFFISLACPRNCYFCFNPNQEDYAYFLEHDVDWRRAFDEFAASVDEVTHVGLTGGEPLLRREAMLDFFAYVKERAPQAHARLYTSGFGLDERTCADLAERGLDEIRFSVKVEDGEAAIREALDKIDMARGHIADVMVEMPVIPGTQERMRRLLCELDERGVRGINLLEFCFPLHNWEAFEKRGFKVKNPPFDVLYDYGYAGSLPIAGSELACLELMEYALDEGLRLGLHYCSLDNKNRDQLLMANRRAALDPAVYELAGDGLYHVAKAFDGDAEPVREYLRGRGAAWVDEDDGALVAFHPRHVDGVKRLGCACALSYNVIEGEGSALSLRELKLEMA